MIPGTLIIIIKRDALNEPKKNFTREFTDTYDHNNVMITTKIPIIMLCTFENYTATEQTATGGDHRQ